MRILLLREEERNDKYKTGFKDVGFSDVTQIPVLEFTLFNLDKLKDFGRNFMNYSGLIFTSKRAVNAFAEAVDNKIIQEMKTSKDFHVYVVGMASKSCTEKLGFDPLGSECGNALELSKLICSRHSENSKPLMFACGNLARETIPEKLREKNISIESIPCYTTIPNKLFTKTFTNYLRDGSPDAIVFFSPSGAEFYLAEIERLVPEFDRVKIVCIGNFTKSGVEKLGRRVDGVAAKPGCESLILALNELV